MSDTKDILDQAIDWQEQGRKVALATVITTWGSSPRPVGSQLAVADDGAFAGSVSGGCIEGAVVREALEVIDDGSPRLLDFGVSDEQAWEVGLACGGEVKVHVRRAEPVPVLRRLLNERPVALVTHLNTGEHALLTPDQTEGRLILENEAERAARAVLEEGSSKTVDTADGRLFVQSFTLPLRMIVVGAVHITQSLVQMAALAGFEVTVIDPRRAFATDERFPAVTLSDEWPDEALERLAVDSRTAIVTLSHDPKLDDPALEVALRSDAFYVGSLGSRRTHAKRVDRLTEAGLTAEQIGRIHAPIGLDLGGRSPAEIAVSVLAEVIAARHGKDPGR